MGQDWEAILSVKYDDGHAQSDTFWQHDDATTLARRLLLMVPVAAYYPNNFEKSQYLKTNSRHPGHNQDFSSCNGFDCPFWLESKGVESHTTEWCWAGSFFWHEERCLRYKGSKGMVIQGRVGAELGPGQVIEERMAEHLGLKLVRVHCPETYHRGNATIITQQLQDAGVLV